MHALVVFLLASYGVTNIVTASRLFAPLRARLAQRSAWLGHWIHCPMCVGVPVGLGWRLLGLELGTASAWPLELAASGAVSSAWCWIVRVALHRLGGDKL